MHKMTNEYYFSTPKAGAGSYFRFRPRMNRWGGHRSGGGGMHMSSGIGGTSLR